MPAYNKRPNDHAGKQPQTKRRKGGPAAADGEVAVDPAAQEASLKAYLHHAVKLISKAVKKSKTFELQKLTRKVKTTKEPKDGAAVDAVAVADLEAQLQAMKSLSLDSVPNHYLNTRLPKLHCFRTVDFLPTLLASLPKSPAFPELDPISTEGKARNRILANKVVPEAWEEVLRAVRKRMGEDVDGKGKGKEEEEKKPKGITMDPARAAALEAALLQGGEDGEDEGESSEDEGPAEGFTDDEGAGNGEDDEEALVQAELRRLNEDVGSEGEWSGSSDEEDDDAASTSSFPTAKASRKRQPSLSPSPPPTKKAKSAKKEKPITSSSFLPSLAAGYISYSDSDGEDARWVKESERDDKKGARKNRRGQRARQAIWEKKYGTAANHVVKTNGGKPVPLKKIKEYKAKKAAGTLDASEGKPGEAPPSTEPYNPLTAKMRGGEKNPNAQDLGAKARSFGGAVGVTAGEAAKSLPKQGDEKMHPSWLAAKAKKEAQAIAAAALEKPQGKKITFD